MSTLEEFKKEIDGSKELQQELAGITDMAALNGFLKDHGCKANAEEFLEFVKPRLEDELTEDEAATVAGGFGPLISWDPDTGKYILGNGSTKTVRVLIDPEMIAPFQS